MPGNDMNYSNNDNLKRETFKIIPISKIQDFPEHPYKVKDDENMVELVESVKTRGLIQPVLVRPLDNGMYEMVSGHRRKRAFEIAGIEKIPARVQNLTRDEAILSMVDSNLQRDEILPSEKAFAFKMRLEAMKRIGGRPSKENGAPVEHPFWDRNQEMCLPRKWEKVESKSVDLFVLRTLFLKCSTLLMIRKSQCDLRLRFHILLLKNS